MILFGGGLGNQMFQYAFGRHLSIKNNQPLKLDISRYDNSINPDLLKNGRIFGLHNFNIDYHPATEREIRYFDKYYKSDTLLRKIYRKFEKIRFSNKKYFEKSYILEPLGNGQIYDSSILTFPYNNAYFRGFWQSEKYFIDIKDIIWKDFQVKNEPDEYNKTMLANIKKNNSISLHVRMGDNADLDNPHGALTPKYYHEAINLILKKIRNPHFYIFSDNMEWAKNNISIECPHTYVDNPPSKDYEDIRLMSNCKNHIIANSTFSWWGAWLAKNPNKTVIAPKKYSQNSNIQNPDYYPENWILI